MTRPIAAQLLPPLSLAIANAFSLDDLNRVTMLSVGEDIFVTMVSLPATRANASDAVLGNLNGRGLAARFLAAVLKARPGLDPLQALVAAACPEALQPQPSVKDSTADVLGGIGAVGDASADPAVAAAMDRWSRTLEQVAGMLTVLAALKALHDCLHRLQLQQLQQLRDLVRRFATDPNALFSMLGSVDVIRQAARDARDAAAALPDNAADRGVELEWIGQMEDACKRLGQAVDDLDTRLAIGATADLRRIIRSELVRLNSRLVVTVEAVPLPGLITALEAIDRAAQGTARADRAAIGGGLAGLRQLSAALRGRVSEHRQWQDADNKLWLLEDLVDQAPANWMEDVDLYYWPNAAGAVGPLCALDPGAEWSLAIDAEYARVGAALLAQDGPRLRIGLQKHRSQARFRFFDVDRILYVECGEAAKIAPPLRSLVDSAAHVS